MNELFAVFTQLKPELEFLLEHIESECICLRTFEDGSGSIGTLHEWSLRRFEGTIQVPVTWGYPEEGVSILRECISEIKTNPDNFEFS